MHNPLVSIVIPVYNGSNYMREAIDSALGQTYNNIEVIVVNDGSGDGGKTRETALSYGDRIRYFDKENGGVSTALNLAIREMKGDFLSWLSHDDLYFPDKIERQIEYYFSVDDRRSIIFSNEEFIDSAGHIIKKAVDFTGLCDNLAFNLLQNSFIGGCTLLIPKIAFTECGCFNETLKCAQDYEMWFRMMKAGYKFRYLPIASGQSRIHPEQVSNKKRDILSQEDDKFRIWVMETFTPEELWGKDGDNFRYYIETAALFARRGLNKASAFSLMKASGYSPSGAILFCHKTMTMLISVKYRMEKNIRSIAKYLRDIIK